MRRLRCSGMCMQYFLISPRGQWPAKRRASCRWRICAPFGTQVFLGGFKPIRYGGIEAVPGAMFQAASDIATVCASTAWVAQLMAVHAHAIAYYDPRLQEEVWGSDQDALVGSSVAPIGKVEPVDGGYRLSGRYSWSSGCDHASWLCWAAISPDPSPASACTPCSRYREAILRSSIPGSRRRSRDRQQGHRRR